MNPVQIRKISPEEKVKFNKEGYFIETKKNKIDIFIKSKNACFSALISDWIEYSLDSFKPSSLKERIDLMFELDGEFNLFKENNEVKENGVYKVIHLESGLFSKKGVHGLLPNKNSDGTYQEDYAWGKKGSHCQSKNYALSHFKRLIKCKRIIPGNYKNGEDYFRERSSISKNYGIYVGFSDGSHQIIEIEKMWGIEEISGNWSDCDYYDDQRILSKKERRKLYK